MDSPPIVRTCFIMLPTLVASCLEYHPPETQLAGRVCHNQSHQLTTLEDNDPQRFT